MRVSTSTVFEQGVFNLTRAQSQLIHTQEQISTGRRILNPSDDSVASTRALEVSQAQAVNAQYVRNTDSATAAIGLQEEALSRYTSLLQDVKTSTVNAGNGALSPRELKSIASELRGRYDELLGIANTTDANGLFLFSGYQGDTQPFTQDTPGNVAYNGDEDQRQIQIAPTRLVPVSFSGLQIFQKIPEGNATFVTAAASTNTGTGIVSPGTVRNATAWNDPANPGDFEIRFHVDDTNVPPVTTYDIVDTTADVSLLTGAAATTGPYPRTYQSGANITLATQSPPDTNPTPFDYGVDMTVNGSPADGDVFTLRKSESKDIFKTLDELITTLETTGSGATQNTRLANALNTAQSNLDNALDGALTVRAAIGSYSQEIDRSRSAGDDLDLQFSQTLSQLTNLDFAKAISDLTFQQVSLEAAQKSFTKVQGLTLFDYL